MSSDTHTINLNVESYYQQESSRLEAVTTCVGFDDLLDETLKRNMPHVDTMIVVTNHSDKRTQQVARKHGATCVPTDLFYKDGRHFNKGAAINAGLDYFRYHGWRLHFDSDIVFPDNFRRLLFNHQHLDPFCLYGADRMDVVGQEEIRDFLNKGDQQHRHTLLLGPNVGKLSHRLVCNLRGYLPLGFFQLWNARTQKPYPYSLGTAAHDDMMFSALWPESQRRHLQSVICYHLCPSEPKVGQNWDGIRGIARFKK
jgi:glycosyltransferase involved in cell wall biosynthesis